MRLFVCILLFVIYQPLLAAMPDNMRLLVPGGHVNFNGEMGGPVGSFVYSEQYDRFYISTYGSDRGIRCFVGPDQEYPEWETPEIQADNKLSNSSGKSWQCATESMILRVAGSPDILHGYYDSNTYTYSLIFGMVLNPKPVTVNGINYDTERLAIISDHSKASTADSTKRFLTWDLREIGSPSGIDPNDFDPNEYSLLSDEFNPDNLPDMANAEYDSGILMTEVPEFENNSGYGFTDWNDAFNHVLTLQDLANTIGLDYELTNQLDFNKDYIGFYRPAFSTDGKRIYYISKDSREFGQRLFTGVWSTNIENGVTRRLFDDTGDDGSSVSDRSSVTVSEPAVLSVGERNLTGYPYSPDVDQILFNGTEESGNICGLNCIVDDGSKYPPVYPVIEGERILEFLGYDIYDPAYYGINNSDPATWPNDYDPNDPDPDTYVDTAEWPKILSISTDSSGNIYFFIDQSYSLLKYDTEGRLIALANGPQLIMLNRSQGSSSISKSLLKLQVRTVEAPYIIGDEPQLFEQVMFMASGVQGVAGVNVFPACDFTRDGLVTVEDLDFFGEQYRMSQDPNKFPDITDPNFDDYIKADINGDGKMNEESTALEKPSVTEEDLEVLYQFVLPGNVNLDNIVDLTDFATISSNYYSSGPQSWSQGDFDFDQDVDFSDFFLFISCWLGYDN